MKADENLVKLFQSLRKNLREGICLDKNVIDYIYATFSNSDPESILEIISDEFDVERDALLELIFYPGMSLQLQVEEIIERERFHPADEKKLQHLLLPEAEEVPVFFPRERKPIVVAMSPALVESFVQRLNITRQTDKRVTEAVDRYVPADLRTVFKVKMRNAAGNYSENGIHFLCVFLERFVGDTNRLLSCFDLILEILGERKGGTDIYQNLMNRKWVYHQALWKAEKYEKKLKESSMEVLMMRGVRAPFVCRDDMHRRIGLIDTVGRTVFGKTDAFNQQEWNHAI